MSLKNYVNLVRINRRVLITCLIFFFFSQLLFLVNIQYPVGVNFDEFHYVPSAKQYLALTTNQNWEHPPLGKLLMAVGIGILGDRPIGWRYMSTLFGSLTLVAMYLWGLALFETQETAIWIALLTVCNSLLYVQARIGMLDTFMFGFLAWSLAAFTAAWDSRRSNRELQILLCFSGTLMGFATACKWFAVVPWTSCIGLVCLVKMMQLFGFSSQSTPAKSVKAKVPSQKKKSKSKQAQASPKPLVKEETLERDWYDPQLWAGVKIWQWLLYFGVLPLIAYFICFIPLYFVPHSEPMNLWSLIDMQRKMWDGQLRVVTHHPYMSEWWQWPLMLRPIWYAFDTEQPTKAWVRGVLLLGNPLVMWTGIPAVLTCAWVWLRHRSREGFLIFYFYSAFYFCWVLIPRKISFYYYYYPAGMVISLALGYVFHYAGLDQTSQPISQKLKGWRGAFVKYSAKVDWLRWMYLGSSLAIFIYFFPILAALRIPANAFRKWMWFTFWI